MTLVSPSVFTINQAKKDSTMPHSGSLVLDVEVDLQINLVDIASDPEVISISNPCR